MRNTQWNVKGQSTAEYAVVIAIVLGAVVGMQTFVKRGLEAKDKRATEVLTSITGEASNPDIVLGTSGVTTGQYEPYYAARNITTNSDLEEQKVTETHKGNATDGYGVDRSGVIRAVTRGGNQIEDTKNATDGNWQ